MKPQDLKYMFYLGHTKKMTYAHSLDQVSKIIKEFTDDIEVFRFIGFQDSKGNDIYEGHFFRHMTELEDGDDYNYSIVTWIKEWGLFANLIMDEYLQYNAKGVGALDEVMFWTYPLTDSEEYEILGHLKLNPEKINYPEFEYNFSQE